MSVMFSSVLQTASLFVAGIRGAQDLARELIGASVASVFATTECHHLASTPEVLTPRIASIIQSRYPSTRLFLIDHAYGDVSSLLPLISKVTSSVLNVVSLALSSVLPLPLTEKPADSMVPEEAPLLAAT